MNGNNLPPADMPANELLLRLLERPQPSELVEFPARSPGGKPLPHIRIMVLRMEQHDEARIRAREFLKTKRRMTDDDLRSPFGEAMLGDATVRELLAMACFMADPIRGTDDDSRPTYPLLFRSSADVNKLTADEVTALFGAYVMVQKRFGPYEREMDDAEVNAWVERLEAGASDLPLSRLASHQLAALCMSLARRAFTFSRLLNSQRQSLPINWESIPESWGSITISSSAHAADDALSDDDGRTITMEEAMAKAKLLAGHAQ